METKGPGISRQFVVFHVGKEEYAVSINNVQEIIRIPEITRIPGLPPFACGVINLRDKIIPIISLAERFRLPSKDRASPTRIIVTNTYEKVIGLIVDSANEVSQVLDETIELIPPSLSYGETTYIEGVVKLEKRLIILINVDNILTDNEKVRLTDFDGSGVTSSK